ncbi:hypothetical protein T484DRAFT_1579450, partial [Baffinella frigidus]
CNPCPVGTYKDALGVGECILCDAGTANNNVGSTSPAACVQCGVNTWSSDSAAVCMDCTPNSVSPVRSTSIGDCLCNPGFIGFGGTDVKTCAPCAVGSYSHMTGMGECTLCDAGMVSGNTGSINSDVCTRCGENTWSSQGADVCTDCTLNAVSPVQSTSDDACLCSPGFHGAISGMCTPCAVGTYKAELGTGTCTSCAAGTVVNQLGATGCIPCGVNTWSAAGMQTCIDCIAESESSDQSTSVDSCLCRAGFNGTGRSTCMSCPVGTYKGDRGVGVCKPCDAGTVNDQSGASICTPCGVNTWSA